MTRLYQYLSLPLTVAQGGTGNTTGGASSVPVGGITGLGTGVETALTVNVSTPGAFVVNGGALGTPSSGTLTSATGLPISTGVSGLGANVASALGIAVGSAGGPVVLNGAGGTPSSLVGTNITGTAAGLTAGSVSGTGVPYGTTANTAAQGNDSRIVNAAQQIVNSPAYTATDASGASLAFTGVTTSYTTIGNIIHVYGSLTYPVTADASNAMITLPVAVPNVNYAQVPCLVSTSLATLVQLFSDRGTSHASFLTVNQTAYTNAQLSGKTLNFLLIYPVT